MRLVRAVGRFAVVVPPSKDHIPFFVEGADAAGGPLDLVLEHNPGTLLHYSFADDHGCWIQVFERTVAWPTLSFVRPGDLRLDPRPTSTNASNMEHALTVLHERGLIDSATVAGLGEIARTVDIREVGPLVAEVLELEHVSWAGCARPNLSIPA